MRRPRYIRHSGRNHEPAEAAGAQLQPVPGRVRRWTLTGAATIGQYLRAGLVDELHFAIVPRLLGTGERLFDDIGPDPVSPEMIDVLLSLGAFVLALVGLPVLYLQLRDLQRSVRVSAHAAIYVQAADFRAHLVAHPHLRPYFFDGVDIDPDHEDYARVVTIAELVLNYLEHITVMGDAFGEANRPNLDRFCADALRRSPILRQHLASSWAYSDVLRHRLPPDASALSRPSDPAPPEA